MTTKNLLAPLGPNGNLNSPTVTAEKDSILIINGIFLMRPELVGHFDLKILLLVSEKTVLSRAVNRDSFLGSKEEILKKYALRYTPGEKLYFEDAKPLEKADIVIDNNDFENPEIVKIGPYAPHHQLKKHCLLNRFYRIQGFFVAWQKTKLLFYG
ncbi:MAG: hypothetical protein WC846_04175 [Candidatus Gracilibacteria bacterium]